MSFNPSRSLVVTRQAIINGKVRNLTKTNGVDLRYSKKDGQYVVIDQEEADVLSPDSIDREGHRFERTHIWVFSSLKELVEHIDSFYFRERFWINALARYSNNWNLVNETVRNQTRTPKYEVNP